jgi:hypothetical protein
MILFFVFCLRPVFTLAQLAQKTKKGHNRLFQFRIAKKPVPARVKKLAQRWHSWHKMSSTSGSW